MRPPGWLEALVASGEYQRLAAECANDTELAARLGTTPTALRKARKRLNLRGIETPTVQQMNYAGEVKTFTSADPLPGAWQALGERYEPQRLECGCWAGRQHSKSNCKMGLPSNIGNSDEPTPELVGGNDFEDEEPTQPGVPLPCIPDGHRVHKVSTLIDAATGEQKLQWIKTTAQNDETMESVRDAVRKLAEPWAEIAPPQPVPEYSDDDLLCVYPMGDPHIGMLAWAAETGENFDLDIAERNLFAAVDHLVELAPPAKRALVATVGDTLHSDGYNNSTTKGTRVDVDGRTPKMVTTALRTFRRVIWRALQKHEEVEVKIVPGNHDTLMTLVLSIALQQFFENEPRVHIDPSPQTYQWYRFGLNLIGVTHGDKANATGMMGAMAVDRAKDWGETKHRRIYAGHIHHEVVKEVPGVIIEHLRTLASKDAWHAGMGYRSGRDMKLDVFHREDGHVNRHIVGIEAVKRRCA